MVLQPLSGVRDETRLIRHKDTLFKFKILFNNLQGLVQKNLITSIHWEIEEAIAAIIYTVSRNKTLVRIETESLLVCPSAKPWKTGQKLGFQLNGKDLKVCESVISLDVSANSPQAVAEEPRSVSSSVARIQGQPSDEQHKKQREPKNSFQNNTEREHRENGMHVRRGCTVNAERDAGVNDDRDDGVNANINVGVNADRDGGVKADRDDGVNAGRDTGVNAHRDWSVNLHGVDHDGSRRTSSRKQGSSGSATSAAAGHGVQHPISQTERLTSGVNGQAEERHTPREPLVSEERAKLNSREGAHTREKTTHRETETSIKSAMSTERRSVSRSPKKASLSRKVPAATQTKRGGPSALDRTAKLRYSVRRSVNPSQFVASPKKQPTSILINRNVKNSNDTEQTAPRAVAAAAEFAGSVTVSLEGAQRTVESTAPPPPQQPSVQFPPSVQPPPPVRSPPPSARTRSRLQLASPRGTEAAVYPDTRIARGNRETSSLTRIPCFVPRSRSVGRRNMLRARRNTETSSFTRVPFSLPRSRSVGRRNTIRARRNTETSSLSRRSFFPPQSRSVERRNTLCRARRNRATISLTRRSFSPPQTRSVERRPRRSYASSSNNSRKDLRRREVRAHKLRETVGRNASLEEERLKHLTEDPNADTRSPNSSQETRQGQRNHGAIRAVDIDNHQNSPPRTREHRQRVQTFDQHGNSPRARGGRHGIQTFEQKDRYVVEAGDAQEDQKLQSLASHAPLVEADSRDEKGQRPSKRRRSLLVLLTDTVVGPLKRALRGADANVAS